MESGTLTRYRGTVGTIVGAIGGILAVLAALGFDVADVCPEPERRVVIVPEVTE